MKLTDQTIEICLENGILNLYSVSLFLTFFSDLFFAVALHPLPLVTRFMILLWFSIYWNRWNRKKEASNRLFCSQILLCFVVLALSRHWINLNVRLVHLSSYGLSTLFSFWFCSSNTLRPIEFQLFHSKQSIQYKWKFEFY